MIDLHSAAAHLLLNPRLPEEERARLERMAAAAAPLPRHVLLATSGSTGALKLVALSKDAILASAAAVNKHLGATSRDDWACVLPIFHVGGLGIHARALLAGSSVVSLPWEPARFAALNVALSALVPAQVHDLVAAGLRAPPSLRAVVVGGGALDDAAYAAARELGWPLLRSYGMTECCSQVATEEPDFQVAPASSRPSPGLRLLPHVEARTDPEGRIAIRGTSLLTGYIGEGGELVDPKKEGWFVSEDLGRVEGRLVWVEGRQGERIKIGGESVDLARLDRILAELAGLWSGGLQAAESGGLKPAAPQAAIVAMPDERLGQVIHLAATAEADELVRRFNERVLPFERIRGVHRVAEIPSSPLGKLLRARLLQMIVGSSEGLE